jgi:hypothetical protein
MMKRKLAQQWLTIPPISAKPTITSHLNSLNRKKRSRNMTIEIQFLSCDRHTNAALLNRVMESQNKISNDENLPFSVF